MSDFSLIEERVARTNRAMGRLIPRKPAGQILNATILVRVVCPASRPHTLATIYATPEGALFVSNTRARRSRWTPTIDLLDFAPDASDAHPELVVRCRCSKPELLERALLLKAVEEAQSSRKPVTLVAQRW